VSTSNPAPDTTTITADMEPDSEAGSKRLAFLARASTEVCSRALTVEMARARAGEYGDAVKAAAAEPLTNSQQLAAIKNLTAAFIYLMMVDYLPTSPEWLESFLSTTARSLDRILEGPTVREILMSHSGVSGYAICQEAASETIRALNMQKVSAQFSRPLETFLQNSKDLRSDLLVYALSEPLEELEKNQA
jgi:hypothetical protein